MVRSKFASLVQTSKPFRLSKLLCKYCKRQREQEANEKATTAQAPIQFITNVCRNEDCSEVLFSNESHSLHVCHNSIAHTHTHTQFHKSVELEHSRNLIKFYWTRLKHTVNRNAIQRQKLYVTLKFFAIISYTWNRLIAIDCTVRRECDWIGRMWNSTDLNFKFSSVEKSILRDDER